MPATALPLHQAPITNSFVEQLPGETAPDTRSRQVPGVCYSLVNPTPVAAPRLLTWSKELAGDLNLSRPEETGPDTDILGGNLVTPSMRPFAARYGGHQFGQWAGQLGDGRAITLGELTAQDGSRQEIQLKGAGPTPYSRAGDGRAVLRSSLREFLCSEAMHWLGVPTTRALSLVGTGEAVVRDMFYTGHPRPEPGAIVARVAPTFVRFGNFQMLYALGETANLKQLADFVLRSYYPELGEPGGEVYAQWFHEICRRTGVMVAQWMAVGFVHGVMNTDNMSILGLTIDYGPYGWLEPYDLDWTPNTTDFGQRRYAYGQQPGVALWNLSALGQALSPLFVELGSWTTEEWDKEREAGLNTYRRAYVEGYRELVARKLGLTPGGEDDDLELFQQLHKGLSGTGVDMTLFFRGLAHLAPELVEEGAHGPAGEPRLRAFLEQVSYPETPLPSDGGPLLPWLGRYALRLHEERTSSTALQEGMLAANPKYVLRNYLAQQASEAAENGDLGLLNTLMQVLRRPFDEQPEHEHLAVRRPDWAREKPGAATLSCSS